MIRRAAQAPVSLEKPVGDQSEAEYGQLIADEDATSIESICAPPAYLMSDLVYRKPKRCTQTPCQTQRPRAFGPPLA